MSATPVADPMNPAPLADGSYELTYAQTFQPKQTPTFNPGTVRIARRGDTLHVEARLTDWDIHDPSDAKFNDEAYRQGDVFELFIRAEGDDHYHEIHTTPGNVLLQLRFNVGEPLNIANALVWEPLVTSETERFHGGWIARFTLPLANITSQRPLPSAFRIGCGRYDYQPGLPAPVISNTAPLTAANFHLHHEWPLYRLG